MSYPQPERGEQDKAYMDAAETQQAAVQTAEPQQPRPVVPIILSSEKPGDKVKEITARLEQGIQAIFDSDRYKEFLTAMSKFHDYSLNNTILIVILSRLVDTFFSRISPTMQLPPKHHSIAYVLPWAEGLHWQSRSSGCSNS